MNHAYTKSGVYMHLYAFMYMHTGILVVYEGMKGGGILVHSFSPLGFWYPYELYSSGRRPLGICRRRSRETLGKKNKKPGLARVLTGSIPLAAST